MKFTDRFIKIPTKIFDRKQKELTGKEELEDSFEKILPFEVSNYRPTYDGQENHDVTNIGLKNGTDILTYLTIDQFEKLLNEHEK